MFAEYNLDQVRMNTQKGSYVEEEEEEEERSVHMQPFLKGFGQILTSVT